LPLRGILGIKRDSGGDAKEVGQRMPAEETCAARTYAVISACGRKINAKHLPAPGFATTFS